MSKSLHGKTYFYVFAFLAILVLVIIFGLHRANANTSVKVAIPDEQHIVQTLYQEEENSETPDNNNSLLVVPLLLPPSRELYTVISREEGILPMDGRPIAILADSEDKIERVSVYLPELFDSSEQNEVSFQIVASVLYMIDGFEFVVSTSRPSPDAANYLLGLGNNMIKLNNGAEGWMITNIASKDTPNRVVFVEDDLIITIASNVPLNQLEEIAGAVIVER
ncbi:MAG: hypothetical protein HC804_03245 [Anaerolineae bacterium]|nr:hypothetical protein [Anaerolineae bacterium]